MIAAQAAPLIDGRLAAEKWLSVLTGSNRMSYRGYSLSDIFLLTASCGVLLALITPLVRGRVAVGELLFCALASGIAFAVLGLILGLFHVSRLRGGVLGVLVGALLGVLAGPVILIGPGDFPWLLLTAIGGALLVVAIAVGVRLASHAAAHGRTAKHAEPLPRRPHPLDAEEKNSDQT